MNYGALSAACLACLSVGMEARQRSSPSTAAAPTVVMIHGRDQQAGNGPEVEAAWNRAIDTSLAGINLTELAPRSTRRFYWYGDTLRKEKGCAFAFSDAVWRAADWAFWPEARKVLVAAAGQLPNAAQQTLLNSQMEDTAKYLGNGSVACEVDDGLASIWDAPSAAAPVIVIAHSMGSMVLYKNLMNALARSKRPTYIITIGSMVGVPAVQRTLLGSAAAYPAPVPLPVVWWRNIVNRGDHLAFNARAAFWSETPAKIPVDVPIDAPDAERHAATAYLGSTTFANTLREAWCLASRLPATCTPPGPGKGRIRQAARGSRATGERAFEKTRKLSVGTGAAFEALP
jgi:hypothetical protein